VTETREGLVRFAGFAVGVCVGSLLAGACVTETSGEGKWSGSVEVVAGTTVIRTPSVDDERVAIPVDEVLRIGVRDGAAEYQFGYPTRAVPGGGGEVYVWDEQLKTLRKYDAMGRFVRNIGGVGEGPGEFRTVEGLVVTEGDIVLWDGGNGRANVYDIAGVFRTSWRVPQSPGYVDTGLATDARGAVYLPQTVQGGDAFIEVRLTDGTGIDTVLAPALEPGERLRAVSATGLMLQVPIPFAPERFVAFHPGGFFIGGVGDDYRITLFRRDAEPLRIEREVEAIPISGGKRRQLRERLTDVMRMADPGWEWEGPPIPEVLPYFVGLTVGSDGTIWVRRTVAPEESVYEEVIDEIGDLLRRETEQPETFDVFGADGRLRGQVVLPENATLLSVDGKSLWARVLGERGAEFRDERDGRGREPDGLGRYARGSPRRVRAAGLLRDLVCPVRGEVSGAAPRPAPVGRIHRLKPAPVAFRMAIP